MLRMHFHMTKWILAKEQEKLTRANACLCGRNNVVSRVVSLRVKYLCKIINFAYKLNDKLYASCRCNTLFVILIVCVCACVFSNGNGDDNKQFYYYYVLLFIEIIRIHAIDKLWVHACVLRAVLQHYRNEFALIEQH